VKVCVTMLARQGMLFNALEGIMTGEQDTTFAETPGQAVSGMGTFAGRILLVEDSALNQMITTTMLQSLGIAAELARNGREAVEAVGRNGYDLVLMDCQMPEMDGYTASRTIRELERRGAARSASGRRLPIIALTAHAGADDREDCFEAGMDDFLSKPFFLEQLRDVLSRWLGAASPSEVTAKGRNVEALKVEEVLDPSTLETLRKLRRDGQPDLLAQVIRLYLADSPRLVEAVRTAVAASEAPALAKVAHTLKSSSGNIGARRFSTLCAQLQDLGRAGDCPNAVALLAAFEAEYGAACAAARALLPAEPQATPVSRVESGTR
jgi:two-component system sensor histidine kinase/response regulator